MNHFNSLLSREHGTPRAISSGMMKKTNRNEFLAEVRKLGGTTYDALDWLIEAERFGIDADDTADSLAWACVDDELANLDPEDDRERAATLRVALAAARRG
jgi:hypothetical protein